MAVPPIYGICLIPQAGSCLLVQFGLPGLFRLRESTHVPKSGTCAVPIPCAVRRKGEPLIRPALFNLSSPSPPLQAGVEGNRVC
jgi:hypothetical protein